MISHKNFIILNVKFEEKFRKVSFYVEKLSFHIKPFGKLTQASGGF